MPRIAYMEKRFGDDALLVIANARRICESYAQQGYDLTLRQVYYQFVARDLFPADRTWSQTVTGKWVRDPNGTPNAEPNYKWLGSIINDARMAGLLDWDYIVDRTRNLRSMPHWDDPAEIIESAASSFAQDKWADQPYRVEVWIEKDALVGVLEQACPGEDVPFFSCRGYTSQSEVWGAAQRLGRYLRAGQKVAIIHLGDHDPSGIDMTRDIQDRLFTFMIVDEARRLGRTTPDMERPELESLVADFIEGFEVQRIALNMDQIEQYDPPPNPAKVNDSRARAYIAEHGTSSWELDALEPTVLVALIRGAIDGYRDPDLWEVAVDREAEERKVLTAASERWEDVKVFLAEDGGS